MRVFRKAAILCTLALLALLTGCADLFNGNDSRDPSNLSYSVTTETTGGTIGGVMLTWDAPRSRDAWSYAVYGRESSYGEWYLIGITTSTTFHDAGYPQSQYFVAARDEDDNEFGRTRTVTIEYAAALAAPDGLEGISLDGAIQLSWLDNARQSSGSSFRQYRVFSTGRNSAGGCDVSGWAVEGATISSSFLVSGLVNGVTRCFGVTAVNRDGVEGALSRPWVDTPRHDARHVVIDAFEVVAASSGFLFHDVAGNRYGAVVDGTRADIDFRLERADDGTFALRALRDAVRIAPFGSGPVPELTSVGVAPISGYTLATVQVQPGHAYVFRITSADGVRYGVVRVAYLAAGHAVVDWAYQPAAGNPELGVSAYH